MCSQLKLNDLLFIYSIHQQSSDKKQLLISLDFAKDVWAAAAAAATLLGC